MKVFIEDELSWVKTSFFKKHFELQSGFYSIGELDFANMRNNKATGHFGDCVISLVRKSIWKPKLDIKDFNTGELIAEFLPDRSMHSGNLNFGVGKPSFKIKYRWTSYTVTNEEGEKLISMKFGGTGPDIPIKLYTRQWEDQEFLTALCVPLFLVANFGYK